MRKRDWALILMDNYNSEKKKGLTAHCVTAISFLHVNRYNEQSCKAR